MILFSFDLPLILMLLSSESFDIFEPIGKPIIFFSHLLFYFTLCFNTNLVVLFLPLDVSV